jgi:hypothetical protein
MKCACHPDVETNLACGKCGKPICPRCMVQTPVGARCRGCAHLYKLPTYRVTPRCYFIASGVGLGMAIACGMAWGLIEWIVPFFSLGLLLAPAAGYGIGEVIGLAINRKRGWGLATIAGVATAVCYIISLWLISVLSGVPFSGVLPVGVFVLPYHLIALGLGVFVAITRLR